MTPNRLRAGSTLIELLVVIVLVGVLAAITVPRYSASKEQAYVATMKADLRNAAAFEEQYASEHDGIYFSGTATWNMPYNNYRPSTDVTVTFLAFDLVPASMPGWSATATHARTSSTCEMRAGMMTCSTAKGTTTGLVAFYWSNSLVRAARLGSRLFG